MKHLTVTAAIILHDHEVLCMQRSKSKYDYLSYKYEFPGGKLEVGESLQACLKREIREELALHIHECQHYLEVVHAYEDFSITLHAYLCPVRERKFSLKEHAAYVWLKKDQLLSLDWAGADLPIVEKLMKEL